MYQALVESKLATGAFARADATHDPGLFTASAQCDADKLDAARDALLKTLETLATKEFTADEVEKAKARSKRNAEELPANATGMSQALSSASALGDWRLMFVQRDRTAAVTAADVNRVAKTYFQPQNRTVGVFVPEKEPRRLAIPATPAADAVVKDYKGGKVKETGEAFDPTPANLDARLKTTEVGGLKVGLLPKKNRGETVSLVLTLHYGNEESLKGQTTAAGLLPALMLAGTAKHDRQALREELDTLGVRISPGAGGGGRGGPRGGRGGAGGGNAGQLTFSVEAKRETLPKALTLLAEILREPAFPAAEFDTMKRAMRSGLAGSATDPQALASNALARALSPYKADDVRYVPTLDENLARIDAVTLDQVKAVYQTQVGATKGELAVVGEFDPDATLAQVKELLAGWKSDVPVRRINRKAGETAGAKSDILTPDKANAVFLAGLSFPLTDADPDYPALRLGNFLLGGGTLSSRLGDRIRQKEGLSYGVTSQLTASPRDPAAAFTITDRKSVV